ncbi:hypothetical protein LPB04_17070 [Massilia litorea]|uniref:Uncharacterized protein n=2 Tax=Massilia litorea TaxID=2769491 RepID=A0A7L9U2K9_9BURK|nr:hypothetical protein LPB04_17070 [Massilia litorea]
MTFMLSNKARLRWAGVFVPAVTALCATAAPTGTPAEAAQAAISARPAGYSVVNLGPDASKAMLNERGQAAFVVSTGDEWLNWFFDGSRLHALGSLGRSFAYLRGLNNRGVVVGTAQNPFARSEAFSWSLAGGMRLLPGSSSADAFAINDCNQVAGTVEMPGSALMMRASRWNVDGSMTALGPPPATFSAAWAINESGVTAGAAADERRFLRATVWDAAGRATDLGALGGSSSAASHVNASGQVLGTAYREFGGVGFLWSRQTGIVQIGPDAGNRDVTALNDNGDVAGNNQVEDDVPGVNHRPFIWSMRGGLRPLPLAGAPYGRAEALNNRREMVGYVQDTPMDALSRRAVYWNDVSTPVDLNTRLYRAPAGLVLYSARAINGSGSILADSNAGLVLLRPGREGPAAPVLGPIAGVAEDVGVRSGDTVDLTVNFTDSAVGESHLASASVDDGCPQAAPSLRERRGVGDVSLRHTFCRPGFATVKITVTDRAGNATQVQRRLFVIDRSVATLAGEGVLAPAARAGARSGKAPLRFAVWAPLDANPGAGARAAAAPVVTLTGPFHFRADAVGKPERNGQSVRLAGTGRLDGRPGYRFSIEAGPGDAGRGAADRLRVRISHTDAATRAELVDYDNGPGTASMASLAAARAPVDAADGTLVARGSLRIAD